ncbi:MULTISPECIES: MFS transporter [unclassified Streptomyces]|uniref:MFS transporter n=1 Tax=unclassified Streptomyces TaxID=2593676 RepID=UPI003D724DC8
MKRLRVLSIVATVGLSTFLIAVDNSVVYVALPRIGRELALSDAALKWVAAAYPLALASFLLIAGQFTDTVGRRRTLLTGVAFFTVASVLCALSSTGASLLGSRALQGVGAAFVLPASLAITSHDLPPRVRTAAFGAMTAAMASALAFGPVVSGVVTQRLGWQWLFALSVPLGLFAFAMGAVVLPRAAHGARGARPRTPAAMPLHLNALACVSVAAFAYVLIQGPGHGFTETSVLFCAVAAGCGFLALYCVRKPGRSPALAVLLRRRAFTGGLVTQLLWGLGVTGVYFYTSQFLQNGLRLSPTEAGLAFTPVVCALFATVPFVGALARRFGDARIAASGLFLVAVGLLLVAVGSTSGRLAGLLPGLASVGTGSALALPLTTRAMRASPDHLSGFAAGLFSATREVSGVFGIVIVGALVTFVQDARLAGGATAGQSLSAGYRAGLCLAAVLVGAGVPVARWSLRGPRTAPARTAFRPWRPR